MDDHNDGSYSYEYSMVHDGVISVGAMIFKPGVMVEYYNNSNNLDGMPYHSEIQPNIDGRLSNHRYMARTIIHAMVKAPMSGMVTFYLDSNHAAEMTFDGMMKITQDETFSQPLVKNEYYYVKISLKDYTNTDDVQICFSWSYSGQPKVSNYWLMI